MSMNNTEGGGGGGGGGGRHLPCINKLSVSPNKSGN
jgi:hypothetical protein